MIPEDAAVHDTCEIFFYITRERTSVIRRSIATLVLLAGAWGLRRLSISIDDGPSLWTSEPQRFTKYNSWSSMLDLSALVLAFLALAILLRTLFPEHKKRSSRM
ncbi:MAG: hypothetical protein GXP29_00745 [Planctomycetes bacterium]|nr:hypothetical protein [Planctomycetota bacterium]